MLQLENNVIVSGQPEQLWETYETTKECIIDTIASTISPTVDNQVRQEASKVEISCWSRVGRYKLGWPQPISVTFHKKEDKQKLITNKNNLPNGIFVNEEFLLHIKRNRDILRPILRLAKSLPEYRTKCKLENDRLIINGINYTENDLQITTRISSLQSSQKSNTEIIGFHGELSPWSNFHLSPFQLEGKKNSHC